MIPAAHLTRPDPVTLDIGGITLNHPDEIAECVIEKLTGWRDSPGVKGQGGDRPNAHGSFAERIYRSARVVGVEGMCFAANRGALLHQVDRLASLLSPGTPGRLTVIDPDQGARWCDVLIAGEILIEPLGDTHFAFRFEVIAPDPVKYGAAQRSVVSIADEASGGLAFDLFTVDDGSAASEADSGFLEFGDPGTSSRAILVNHGTAATTPNFLVAGPCDGFEIHEASTGSSIIYSEPVPAGSKVSISSEGVVLLDSIADRSAYLTRRDWWKLPPGTERTVSLIATGGPATLTVSYNSGWW